jgi:3-methyladenine DNA glycosylase AlkC
MVDRNAYVRRNLGPFVLGTAMLRYYPEVTFDYLTNWSTSHDEQALWNVAMAFSASAAPAIAKKALIILRKLSLDERRYVWRAVATAMWKLGKKKPELIQAELQRWLEDERRTKIAREALKHL